MADKELKDKIANFYDQSSPLWEVMCMRLNACMYGVTTQLYSSLTLIHISCCFSLPLTQDMWGEHMHMGHYGADGEETKTDKQAQIDMVCAQEENFEGGRSKEGRVSRVPRT